MTRSATARRRLWGAVAVLTLGSVAALALTMAAVLGDTTFEPWPDGTVHGPWLAVFDGDGTSGSDGDTIVLRPRRSVVDFETHAALVVSVASYRDVDLDLRMRTVAQLRRPRPNPWEVAWVVWDYTDNDHFYYLALKPNGWELGKRDPAYPGGQRFLATGSPAFPPGPWYSVHVAQRGTTTTVRVGDDVLRVETDRQRPYTSGRVGLYTEDAEAEFDSIGVSGA